MENEKSYIIMSTAWNYNDEYYYVEGEKTGHVMFAFKTLAQAEKTKARLEYEFWQNGVYRSYDDDEWNLWLYLGRVAHKEEEFKQKISKKYDLENLSMDGYIHLKKMVEEELEYKYQKYIIDRVTDEDWRKALEEYHKVFIGDKIKNQLQSEGHQANKEISEKGLNRLKELYYQEYTEIPEFYYIQEVELIED